MAAKYGLFEFEIRREYSRPKKNCISLKIYTKKLFHMFEK